MAIMQNNVMWVFLVLRGNYCTKFELSYTRKKEKDFSRVLITNLCKHEKYLL